MRRALSAAVVLAALVLVAPAAPKVATTYSCAGAISVRLMGTQRTARSFRVREMTCTAGIRIAQRFLRRARHRSRCRTYSGCRVSRFDCFFRQPPYCAHPGGREVLWRLAPAFRSMTRCGVRADERPSYLRVDAIGMSCVVAHGVIDAPRGEHATSFRWLGRRWSVRRELLSRLREQTTLRSGSERVVILSLPYG